MTVTLKYMMKETFVSQIVCVCVFFIVFTRAAEKQSRAGIWVQVFLTCIFASFPEIELLECSFKLWLVVLISYSDT